MMRLVIFELLQLLVSWFAIRRGGAPERIVGWMLLIAAIVSLAIGVPANRFHGLSGVHFGIDLILLIGLFGIALRANRFWPYWLAALQLIAMGVHGARAIDPSLLATVYAQGMGKTAYPMLVALAIGTWHYARRARLEGAAPRPWSPLRWS